VPTLPARLQRINGSVQAVLQHTPLAQKPVPHCDGVAQAPPCGTGEAVAVGVTVGVAVRVGVFVTVAVCVAVAVTVGVLVGVNVGPQSEPATLGSQQSPARTGSHTSPGPEKQKLPAGSQGPVNCVHPPAAAH
jgi:hypothetical protein